MHKSKKDKRATIQNGMAMEQEQDKDNAERWDGWGLEKEEEKREQGAASGDATSCS